MRTRDYVEKGEAEGKSLLDAMRDGDTEGMQYFDGEISKLIRTGVVDFETGLTFSSNAGNLRLELADFTEGAGKTAASKKPEQEVEMEIER
jgi:twitching motility protein PilT